MGTIWLVCCSGDEMAAVRREIGARDASAQLVRFADQRTLLGVLDVFAGARGGAAIFAHGGEERTERTVAELARDGRAESILVFTDEPDAGAIARLFYAGATEVIAAGGISDPDDASGACTEEGPGIERSRRPPACGGPDLEIPPWPLPPSVGRGPGGAPHAAASGSGRVRASGADAPADTGARKAPAPSPAQTGPSPEATDANPVPGGAGCDGGPKPAGAATAPAATGRATGPGGEVPTAAGAMVPEGATAPAGPDGPVSAPAPGAPAVGAGRGASSPGAPVRHAAEAPAAGSPGRRAPVIAAISGRGGCGKSTVVAAMAWWAAHMGLRAAVIDFDLMFGNLADLMGVDQLRDIAGLVASDGSPSCSQQAIEATAMRIAPGLTLWGPCSLPEQAELLSGPGEGLVDALRGEADVIFADTSVFWGDAAAAVVAHSDRCLVVGSGGVSSDASTTRAVALASRIGVPKTRMTSVFNRFGAAGCDEERAMRFEMAVALRSRMRIADGGSFVSDLLSFGRLGDLMVVPGAFARDVQTHTYGLLKELGCPLEAWEERQRAQILSERGRPRIRLPWRQREGGAAR